MDIFLFSIIANIFGALLISWLTKKENSSPPPLHSNNPIKFENPKRIVFASSCALMSWLCMLATLIGIIMLFARFENILFLIISFLSLLFMVAAYLISGIQLKCVNCKKRIFVQVAEHPEHSVKFKGLTGWSSIVLQVLILKSFTCMHCGQVHTT